MPVAFCVPPDVRYVEGSRRMFAPSGPQPYPRAPNMPDWMEEWRRVPVGRWALIAAHYVAPRGRPVLPTGATEVRQSVVTAARTTAGSAVLREYRVADAPGHKLGPPPGEEVRGFGTGPHRADLVIPLGPGSWLVLEANLENSAQRAELIRVLRSARWLGG